MSERKPTMDEDKRKVLNLLEYLAEVYPKSRVCQIINNAIPQEELSRRGNDTFYITDKELVVYLQDYIKGVDVVGAKRVM
jgi:hypothetical protein